ncbi:hypothetical protein DFH09DRAFT_1320116 [Mycena vulgaris]|nr:hypothetical protein DFH09DRAFT_1320116 [Mycena vulgaris]
MLSADRRPRRRSSNARYQSVLKLCALDFHGMGLCLGALGGCTKTMATAAGSERASWREVCPFSSSSTSIAPLFRRDAAPVAADSAPLAHAVLAAGEVNTPHSANANARTLETGGLLLVRDAYPLLLILLIFPSRPPLPHYFIARPIAPHLPVQIIAGRSVELTGVPHGRLARLPACGKGIFLFVPSSHPPRLLAPVKRPYRDVYLPLAGIHEAGYLHSGTSVGALLALSLVTGRFCICGPRPWAVRREKSLVHAPISFFCASPSRPAYYDLFPPASSTRDFHLPTSPLPFIPCLPPPPPILLSAPNCPPSEHPTIILNQHLLPSQSLHRCRPRHLERSLHRSDSRSRADSPSSSFMAIIPTSSPPASTAPASSVARSRAVASVRLSSSSPLNIPRADHSELFNAILVGYGVRSGVFLPVFDGQY